MIRLSGDVRPALPRLLAVAAACMAIVAAAAWASGALSGREPGAADMQRLIAGTTARVTDGRLTGGFRFADAASSAPKRSGPTPLSEDARLAIARLEQLAADPTSGRDIQLYLARARALEHRFTEAASILTGLAAAAPTADVWSDLAAVRLSVGEPQDIAGAAAAAERALAKTPSHPEALFNRALAVERLRLVPQAAKAWQEFLAVESSSPWADEARAHLSRLTDAPHATTDTVRQRLLAALDEDDPSPVRQIVAESTQDARDLLEDELLAAWSARIEAAGGAAAPGARAMRALAAALTERTGDPLLQESVSVLLAAPPKARRALREAHAGYAQARGLYDRFTFSTARPLFEAAAAAMKQHGDPFWRWPAFHVAAIAYQQNDLEGARRDLDRLDAQSKRYGAVGARVAWMSGIIAASWNNFDDAFARYRAALAYFQKAGERDNIAAVNGLLADNYLLLGAERQAWESQFEALSVNLGLLRARRRQLVAFTGMQAAIRTGAPEAALYFNSAFIDAARQSGNPTATAEGHLHRARLYYQLHDCARASASLRDAEAQLSSAEASGSVDFLRAQLVLVQAGASECRTDANRLDALSSAVGTFQRSTRALWLPRALLARARELRRLGRAAEADQDLRTGIDLLERSAGTLGSSTLRVEYTDEVWDLFDEMIDLQLAANQPERAWDFAERGHVQAGRERVAPLGASAVVAALPAGHALLYYAFTKAQVVLFAFTSGGFKALRLEPDVAGLTERIRRFTTKLEAGRDDGETRALAERLYQDLVAGAVSGLPDDTRIHIVADGPLYQLPFHALIAAGETRPLFERFLVSNASSATSLLAAKPRPRPAAPPIPALVLGDPAGDDFGLALPRLPSAAQEAANVAGFYQGSQLYLGERATRDVLLGSIGNARVVHFAGHAVVDERYPELSRLILASATKDGPRHVLMRDLADVVLPQTELVVLAACETGVGSVFKGRGALSLASPFVAAGVPAVVSTLWPIDDRSAGRLFAVFQKHVASGVEPLMAMRRAQQAVRDDPSLTPWSWAAASTFTTLATR